MKLINLALEGQQMKAAYERARAKLKENAAKAVESKRHSGGARSRKCLRT
jgi:hypothetical protein